MVTWTDIARRKLSRDGLRYPSDMTDVEVGADSAICSSGQAWRPNSDGRHARSSERDTYIAASGCAWRLLLMCWLQCARGSNGYAMCSLKAAMQAKNCDPPSSAWPSGQLTSSSDRTGQRVSTCHPVDGLSSELSHGSTAADGLPRTEEGPAHLRQPWPSLPPSAC